MPLTHLRTFSFFDVQDLYRAFFRNCHAHEVNKFHGWSCVILAWLF
jgi:hypothetical protein